MKIVSNNDIVDLNKANYLVNKDFAETIMLFLEKSQVLTDHEIELLRSRDYCRVNFFSDYPMLRLIDNSKDLDAQLKDNSGRNRYYSNVHELNNNFYVMTSQLYGFGEGRTHRDNRTPFFNWVLDKVSKGDGEVPLKTEEIINHIKSFISSKGFSYEDGLIENFYLSLKSKPFVILAGTSGTGKTKLVKMFAEAIGAEYKMVAVRPDWSDSSDLFGHLDLNGNYVEGAILDFVHEAQNNLHKPYILCMDEMNLARVEYYLSDFLSIIETREFVDDTIVTEPLVALDKFGLDNESKEKYGEIIFPENLYLVGTVNMDETTFPFSKKVLDRANTIEFNFVDLNYVKPVTDTTIDTLDLDNDFLKTQYLYISNCDDDSYIDGICKSLQDINNILKESNAHVGYRVRDEIAFYMLNNKQTGLLDEDEAFDFEIMQKILPRIQGSSSSIKAMLVDLFKYCLDDQSGLDNDSGENMCNLAPNAKYKLSAAKIGFMMKRYEEDGFTSYWL